MDDLERHDIYVTNLQSALNDGEHGLNAVPGHIKLIIKNEMWQERVVQATGEVVTFDDFRSFINTHPPEGLGASLDMLKRMCDEDPDALRLLREVVTDSHGGDRKSEDAQIKTDNISLDAKHGTSKDYTLDRIAREDPDLYEKVVADEMSAHAAAIEAGFRTKTVSVPVHKGGEPQIERAARSLAKHFNGSLDALIEQLKTHVGDTHNHTQTDE